MPLYFQRPENALKRANEFIDVGERQWALDALYDVIKSRKHRTWQKIHEPIMCKYLELCVELKKSHVAKEGLFQYRNICQQVNIKSLEDVVRGYLHLAEQKTEAAQEESQQAVVDIDDLDHVQTPESLLLSAVSSEDHQDRSDRVLLAPWVKFLWESYRQCLELLRNNSRVERLYHDIAQQAFRFCLKYNRKTEFRKLCDNLRTHLGHIHKHQNQQTSVNLNNPESQAMHLETRLVQLDSAIHMELWQEAYKAIEDIHLLMNMSKKAPNPRLMANYYQKLSLVFYRSNNYLFHAAALFRLFYLSREQKKNITSEEIQKMAAKVVLATLAIPMPPNRAEIDRLVETDENAIDKNHRVLSTLLGLPNPPSRASLIKDLARFGIIHNVPMQIQNLYRWLETEFHPLKLCDYVQQSFDFLNNSEEFPELCQYIPAIKDITVVRLIKEIAQIYSTIRFSKLLKLIPFVDSFNLEYIVVQIARRNGLQARVDQQKQCFHFKSDLNVSQREEIIEGPHLQSMPSEQMRHHLIFISSVLSKAEVYCIQPETLKIARKELCKEIVKAYNMSSSKEHIRILNRQQIIEERKELLENLNYQKEAKERKLLEDQQQKLREAEKERMARETEERNKQRLLREQTELKKKVVMEKIEQLKKTEIGSRLFIGMDEEDLEKLDPDDLLNRQVEQLDRERKELQAKLRKQERNIDHLERAKRIEEIPLLQAEYEDRSKIDKEFWDQHEKERIRAIKEERTLAVQYRDRLLRLREDKDKFLEHLKAARTSVFKEKVVEFKRVLEEEKTRRLVERKQRRKEERKEAWIKEQEEKHQRLIDEKRKKEREEEIAKLEEIEAKKRAKELEIEERLKREQESAALELKRKKDDEENVSSGFLKNKDTDKPTPVKSFANWREREQEKRQSWAPQEKSDRSQEKAMEDLQDWRKKSDEPRKTDDRIKKTDDRLKNDDWRKRDSIARDKPTEDRSLSRDKLVDDKPWRKEKPAEERPWRNDVSEDRASHDDSERKEGYRRRDDKSEEKWPVEDNSWVRDKLVEDKPWRRDEKPVEERAWRGDGPLRRRDEKPTDEKPWRRDGKYEEKQREQYDEKPSEERTWRRGDRPEEVNQCTEIQSEERPWRRDEKHYDRPGRHDGKPFQSSNESEAAPRDWSSLRAVDKDRREPDDGANWRSAFKNKDEKRDTRRFYDKDPGDNKDQRNRKDDRERFSKYKSEDSFESRVRYGSDRGFQGSKDRPSSRFSSDKRDDGWRRREEGPPTGSWRDRASKDDERPDKRAPRDDTSKRDKEPYIDEEGFVKVRR